MPLDLFDPLSELDTFIILGLSLLPREDPLTYSTLFRLVDPLVSFSQ